MSNFSAAVTAEILKRDHFQCRLCFSSDNLDVVYIIPSVKGGKGVVSNGVTLCSGCKNLAKRQFINFKLLLTYPPGTIPQSNQD